MSSPDSGPNLNINITAITHNSDGSYSGTYEYVSGPGGPGTVQSNGDIDLSSQTTEVDIAWTIAVAGYSFRDKGFSATAIQQFGEPCIDSTNATCTVDDLNEQAQWEYSLYLKRDSDGKHIKLDPIVINR
jgi:hypothetical protein